jgi:hypothetical protein
MKTYSLIGDRSAIGGNTLRLGRETGSVTKALLALLAVGAVGAGGFYVYAKGKPLSESPLSQLTQTIQSSVSNDEAEPVKTDSVPPDSGLKAAPVSSLTQEDLPESTAGAAAVVQATPVPLRTAPAGMVFLAKRVTVTRETGISSFPAGTLVLVKSKTGGKIRGTINGVNIEVVEAQTSTTFQQ